jgi:recombining binding protein (suppressor of hairless)
VSYLVDEVDDYLCWTIVGISKFQYTFFDALGQVNRVPESLITPFPTLFTAPIYRPQNNSLELTVANFFYIDTKTGAQLPLDVYLGNIGPLRSRVYQAPGEPPGSVAHRYASLGALHSVIIVDMPDIGTVIAALSEDLQPSAPTLSSPTTDAALNGTPGISPVSTSAQQSLPPPPPPSHPTSATEAAVQGPPPTALAGRSLPLLFVRSADGIGYHSGRTIALDNVFAHMEHSGALEAWQSVAQQAVGGGHFTGWSLRVM